MSFFNWFRKKKNKKTEIPEENIQPVRLTDQNAINHYVVSLCEQMIDVSRDMEEIRQEYDRVTQYFNDISVVEGLEGSQKDSITDVATSLAKLSKARQEYLNADHKISDEMFQLMDESEAELPDLIRRLQSNEKYLDAIKHDLNNLASEKVQWSIRRHETVQQRNRLRRLSKIMMYFLGTLALVVTALSALLHWDMLPILVVALMASIFAAYVILRIQDCNRNIRKCDVNQNQAIALENRVKIKYVNIKNAVDYTCQRFHVNNSMELIYYYEQYIEACKEREKFKQVNEDLEYFSGRLVRLLQGLRLYDAKIWLTYSNAIIDPKEMVEVKHELFGRRQNLRSRIEDHMNAIENMKKEVECYIESMGEKKEQIRTIISRVDEINTGRSKENT